MADTWAGAFTIAVIVSLLMTPLVRRLALATNFVDNPGEKKVHAAPIPYLGGMAVIGAAGIAVLANAGYRPSIVVVGLAAVSLAVVGLIDDRWTLDPLPRLFAEIAAAGAALTVGVRAEITGVPAFDVAITIVWIVGLTNSLNLMDNMDGLAGGTVLAITAGCFALSAFGGRDIVGTAAIALAGACIGFLAFNGNPASIFMGDTGSMFIGYTVGVLTVEVASEVVASRRLPVLLLLVAVPLLDTSTVSIARLRRGKSVADGGKDHLSHRLVKVGFTPAIAVLALATSQAVLGASAVGFGRLALGWVPLIAVSTVVLGLIALVAWPAPVYPRHEPVIGLPRKLRSAVIGLAVVGAAWLGATGLVTRSLVRDASVVADVALASFDGELSQDAIDEGSAAADRADATRSTLIGSLSAVTPIWASSRRAAIDLARRSALALDANRAIGNEPSGEAETWSDLAAAAKSRSTTLELLVEPPTRDPWVVESLQRARAWLSTAASTERAKVDAEGAIAAAMASLESEDHTWIVGVLDETEARALGGAISDVAFVRPGRSPAIEPRSVDEVNALLRDVPIDDLSDDPGVAARFEAFDPRAIENLTTSPWMPDVGTALATMVEASGAVDRVGGVLLVGDRGARTFAASGEDEAPQRAATVAAELATGTTDRLEDLVDGVERGHVSLWVADEAAQRGLASHGLDGGPRPGSLAVLVIDTEGSGGSVSTQTAYDLRLEPAVDAETNERLPGAVDTIGMLRIRVSADPDSDVGGSGGDARNFLLEVHCAVPLADVSSDAQSGEGEVGDIQRLGRERGLDVIRIPVALEPGASIEIEVAVAGRVDDPTFTVTAPDPLVTVDVTTRDGWDLRLLDLRTSGGSVISDESAAEGRVRLESTDGVVQFQAQVDERRAGLAALIERLESGRSA